MSTAGGFNTGKVKVNLDHFLNANREKVLAGLELAAEHVLAQSTELVPIEEGTLQRSGGVSVDDRRLEAAVSYDTPYAVRQHEDLQYHHDEGRTAKFLEGPLNDRATQDACAKIIAQTVRGAWS